MNGKMSYNEIRARVVRFVDEWNDAEYERGEAQSFYDDFFRVFGLDRRRVAAYERQVKKISPSRSGFIDLLWPGTLIVEHKSAGYDLDKAISQAEEYLVALEAGEWPRYMLACDFKRFLLVDLEERTESRFTLCELPDNIRRFGFMLGMQGEVTEPEKPVDIKASIIMGDIYTALRNQGYVSPDAERLLVRLAFCMFAEDTGIFENGLFERFVKEKTREDGSDMGPSLIGLFEVLDTGIADRQGNLEDSIKSFPHVNGRLFAGRIRVPAFDSSMRAMVIKACSFDWSRISPVIFGNLFQGVMKKDEKRREGAHYTTEDNIMRVVEPLFLDDLRSEFEAIMSSGKTKARKRADLRRFQDKLAMMRFLDPACGSGNFLIVAYREIRKLELLAIDGIYDSRDKRLDISVLSRVDVNQFYGIEKNEFSARIAEAGMWMTDHLMNRELGERFGHAYSRIPLEKSPNIVVADALEVDWDSILPARLCSYVLGNPPFGGAKVMTDGQRRQTRRIVGGIGKESSKAGGGTTDYVSGWFVRAAEYARRRKDGRIRTGFVATNSITQGEQVAQLWPVVLGKNGMDIDFAHQTFKWGSEAKGKAHVSVVIVGMSAAGGGKGSKPRRPKRLFYHGGGGSGTGTLEDNPAHISPYMIGSSRPYPVVREVTQPINAFPLMKMGSKPIDGGHYILSDAEKAALAKSEPHATQFIRPYVGAREFIDGTKRWILALHKAGARELRSMPSVMERVSAVKEYRHASSSRQTRELASTPTLYHLNVIPDGPFLIVPSVTSEEREYVPIGYARPPTVPSNAVMVVEHAAMGLFGLLTSRMHMVWLRRIGGRLESRLRYSAGMVYNTFPPPRRGQHRPSRASGAGGARRKGGLARLVARRPVRPRRDASPPEEGPPRPRQAGRQAVPQEAVCLRRREAGVSARQVLAHGALARPHRRPAAAAAGQPGPRRVGRQVLAALVQDQHRHARRVLVRVRRDAHVDDADVLDKAVHRLFDDVVDAAEYLYRQAPRRAGRAI